MYNFLIFITNSIKFLYVISKYQLLINRPKEHLSFKIRFIGYLSSLFFYPVNFLYFSKDSYGKRLTTAIKSLGPVYIKFAQTLSTRPDIVSKEIANHLIHLQDQLPPFDFSDAQKIICNDLGISIGDVYSEFDNKPVAAASIAQVYKAKLKTGEQVAVKILRPGIDKKYQQDLIFLTYLARIISLFNKDSKRLKPLEIIKIFDETMRFELNLKTEAASASRISENFKNDKSLHIPKIYWQHTRENILTLEWIDGVSIYDREKIIALGHDPVDVAAKIAIIFFNMTYRDGFFHADLHPGNILVEKGGTIALIDFGIIGILPNKDRLAIAEILYAFSKNDYQKIACIHQKIGYIPRNSNIDLFAQSVRAIAEPVIGLPLKDISIGDLFTALLHLADQYGMETQPQLLQLQKTIIVVEGIGYSLNPEINMWHLVEPWI